MDEQEILFRETQRFKQWWMWALVLMPLGIGVYGFLQQFGYGIPFGDKPMSNNGLIAFSLFGLAFACFFWCNRLDLKLTKKGVYVNFSPYTKKFVAWENIKSMQIVDHGFTDAWGWGIRLWTKYGTVYNVKFGNGLFIQQVDGKKFLVSTDQGDVLRKILRKHFKHQFFDNLQ